MVFRLVFERAAGRVVADHAPSRAAQRVAGRADELPIRVVFVFRRDVAVGQVVLRHDVAASVVAGRVEGRARRPCNEAADATGAAARAAYVEAPVVAFVEAEARVADSDGAKQMPAVIHEAQVLRRRAR